MVIGNGCHWYLDIAISGMGLDGILKRIGYPQRSEWQATDREGNSVYTQILHGNGSTPFSEEETHCHSEYGYPLRYPLHLGIRLNLVAVLPVPSELYTIGQ